MRKEPYIIQRQGKSGCTFLVRIRTENGEVCKSFNEKDYPNTRIAFETAVRFRNKALVDLSEGTLEKKSKATVREMFEEWIETTTSSKRTKISLVKRFNKYVSFKEKRVQELTRADIIADLNRMANTASDDTIQRVMFVYRTCIIGTALNNEILKYDPSLGVQKPKSRKISKKRNIDTDRRRLDIVKKGIIGTVKDHYDARIINFMLETIYYTGMRPAEAEVLTRDDIKDYHICVSKQLGSDSDDIDVVTNCKTKDSVRQIPIHPRLRPILDELLEYSKYDNVFADSQGRYMNSTEIGNYIRSVCKAENIEFNLYRLRHNMATELVTNKVDDKTTMELLGHAEYNMSLYYASSNDKLKNDAINLIS